MKRVYKKPQFSVKRTKTHFLHGRLNISNISLLSVGEGPPPPPPPDCLLAGTLIHMADGSKKRVEDVRVGDRVISCDHGKGLIFEETVVQIDVHSPTTSSLYIINSVLKITENHPVYVYKGKWKKVRDLKVGDVLLNSQTEKIPVTDIRKIYEVGTTYNLRLSGPYNNYFGGDILLHNRSIQPPAY